MNFIRAFIAIEIPTETQNTIIKQTLRLKQTLGEDVVRWIPAQNLHLTLKFLGDLAPTHVEFVKQGIKQIAESTSSFDMQIGGLGAFPNTKMPRVLWIGLHTPSALTTLQKNIEETASRLGFKKEMRAFSSHLTIGRVKQNIVPQEIQNIRRALETIQLGNIGTARVNSVHLYKSDLNPTGSIYTKLFSANFQQ
ncbi:MAG: RNA 2',3'-cyclic phosphodiesterase [Anaerolineales bacterium]